MTFSPFLPSTTTTPSPFPSLPFASLTISLHFLPAPLLIHSHLYIKPYSTILHAPQAVREIKGAQLGKLITVRGITTRVSDVKPHVLVNAYSCDSCGEETFQEITSRTFLPLSDCPTAACLIDRVKGTLVMQTRASKFVPFQEMKIQEMVSLVPSISLHSFREKVFLGSRARTPSSNAR